MNNQQMLTGKLNIPKGLISYCLPGSEMSWLVPGIWYNCCGFLVVCCTGTVGVLRKSAETILYKCATTLIAHAVNTATTCCNLLSTGFNSCSNVKQYLINLLKLQQLVISTTITERKPTSVC